MHPVCQESVSVLIAEAEQRAVAIGLDRANAELAAMRPVVEAAEALTETTREGAIKAGITQLVRLRGTVDVYREATNGTD